MTTPSLIAHRTLGFIARSAGLLLVASTLLASSDARADGAVPRQFDGVDVKNKLKARLDPTIELLDAHGRTVKLGDFFDDERPVLLTLNYFTCKSLCSTQLNEVVKTLSQLEWTPGGPTAKDGDAESSEAFRMLSISFDPRDSVEVAQGKRTSYTRALVEAVAAEADEELTAEATQERAESLAWDFLVASPANIRRLLDETGYSVRFDKSSGQYAHAPVIFVLSPDGTISRYLWGLTYRKQDLKFALMDASDGNIGSFGDKVLLSCFVFDEDSGAYTAFAWGFMRLGGGLILLLLGAWLIRYWRRERRARLKYEAATSTGQTGLKTAETSP